MINKLRIIELFKNFTSHTDDYMGSMFINIFNNFPMVYRIYYDENDNLIYNSSLEPFESIKFSVKSKVDSRKLIKNIENVANNKNDLMLFCYSSHEYLIIGETRNGGNFLMNITLSEANDQSTIYEEIYTNNIKESFEIVKEFFEKYAYEECIDFGIAAVDPSNSIYTTYYDYKPIELNIEDNYNDDFIPAYERICEIIEDEEKASLMLFYGSPGTGKSTIIKSLITKYPDKEFVIMDGSMLANVSQEKLMSYFLDNPDTVFILEDCEKCLMSREHYINPVMPVLLNLTDGIISDVLKIKFICTFNTALSQIDSALTRPGRLKLKYEFKKLTKEKASKLLGHEATKEMSLAEIYNINQENDYSKKETKKIGF